MDAERIPPQLTALSRQLLFSLSEAVARPFQAAWPEPGDGFRAAPATAPLPVLRWLPTCAAATGGTAPLNRAMLQAAPSLAWRQTYTAPCTRCRHPPREP